MRNILRFLAAGFTMAAIAQPAMAKVSVGVYLCVAPAIGWLSHEHEARLRDFGARIASIASTNGTPEVTITSVVQAQDIGTSRSSAELANSVIHWLRAQGIELGDHQDLSPLSESSPVSFGCKKGETSLEIESVFWHPVYK